MPLFRSAKGACGRGTKLFGLDLARSFPIGKGGSRFMSTKGSGVPNLVPLVWSTLFAALIAAGALLAVPLGGIPFVLSNFFVLLAGLVLGPFWGGLSVLLYLLIGGLGLPVFSGGTGGLTILFGPHAGFLFGFLLAAVLTGLVRDKKGQSLTRNGLAVLLGIVAIYALGIPFYAFTVGTPLLPTAVSMLPLFVGDLIKGALVLVLTRTLFQGLPLLRKTAHRPRE